MAFSDQIIEALRVKDGQTDRELLASVTLKDVFDVLMSVVHDRQFVEAANQSSKPGSPRPTKKRRESRTRSISKK